MQCFGTVILNKIALFVLDIQVWVLDSQPGNVASGRAVTSDVDKVIKEIQVALQLDILFAELVGNIFSTPASNILGRNSASNVAQFLQGWPIQVY